MRYLIILITLLGGCSNSGNVLARFDKPEPVIEYRISPVLIALQDFGFNEQDDQNELKQDLGFDPVETPWCAAYMNAVLEKVGIQGTDSNLARSFINFGEEVESPSFGDIVVFERPPISWQGHVGFYINSTTIDEIEYYRILGGNQSNEVSIAPYPVSQVISIRKF